jgi:hypothetical protein
VVTNEGSDTPVPGPRRSASEESRRIANLGLQLESIAVRLREVAREIDTLEGDERRVEFLKVARELGEHGDDSHVVRRLIEDLYR